MKKIISASLIAIILCFVISCEKTTQEREPITISAPFLDIDKFTSLLHEKYPEVNFEIIPYSGSNTTVYLANMFESGDIPDICTLIVYDPNIIDVSDKLLDLSSYPFTDNYSDSLINMVSDNGAIYMLPSAYNCFGITYNKTLLEKHGWEIPTSFKELEALSEEVKKTDIQLSIVQTQFPGYGFQYLCNIADTGFLSSLSGRKWQKDYLTGKANVSNTPEMLSCFDYIQKWKEIGMLDCTNNDDSSDSNTKAEFMKGNILFMLGSQNGFKDSDSMNNEFGLMPYLSEDGNQNVFILQIKRFMGINKDLESNPQKKEDALKVMEVISTIEGTRMLYSESDLKTSLLPFKDANADHTYFENIMNLINAGGTAPLLYSGWENTVVNTGIKMLEYIHGKSTIQDIINQLDNDQESVVNNKADVITTAEEVISQENCAKLIGRCFAQATNSDLALISLSTWITGNGTSQNTKGVSGKLYAKDITQTDLSTIIPTGWSGTIKTAYLTGSQIKELYSKGFDAKGNGKYYPYVLAKSAKLHLQDSKLYKVAFAAVSEELKAETEVIDSGIVGIEAAQVFFTNYKSLKNADAEWK